MKKGILIIMALVVGFGMHAQNLKVQSALDAIQNNDIEKAKKYIDEATTHESTEKNGKAWLIKAFVYQAIGTDKLKNKEGMEVPFIANINGKQYEIDLNKAKSLRPTTENPFGDAIKAFNRYLYFEKRPEEQVVVIATSSIAVNAYNKGVDAYKNESFDEAIAAFDDIESVANLKKGEFYKTLPNEFAPFKAQLTSLLANSAKYKAYCSYNKGDDKVSLPILEKCMTIPGAADDNIYLMAARIYKKQNNDSKYMATIKSGLEKFPDSKALKNEELNFFVTSDNPEAAAKKLEEAIAADPSSPELHFNLGVMYDKLSASSKDAGKTVEYFNKSVESYKKSIQLDPTNSDYQFNLGALYYNKAKIITDEMNQLPLNDNRYDGMKKDRDAQMGLALPYLEQAKSSLEKKDLKDEMNSRTYKNSLIALQSVYSILGKMDQAKAVGAILNGL